MSGSVGAARGDAESAGPGHGAALAVAALLALHLLVSVPLALILSVWVDEAYSLHSTSGSLAETFGKAIGFEKQAPAYFLLLDLWRSIDGSPAFARLLSVSCVAGTLLAAARLSRSLFPGWSPAWLVAFLAFNPVLIWASVEIRVYPLAILAATLVLLAFFGTSSRADTDPPVRTGSVLLALAGAFAIYTQYYLGFLLAGLGLAVLLRGGVRASGRYALAMAGVGILCLPIVSWLPEQLGQQGGVGARFDAREAGRFALQAAGLSLVPGYGLLDRIGSDATYRTVIWVLRLGLPLAAGALLVATGALGRFLRDARILTVWIAFLVGAAAFTAVGFLAGSNLVEQPRYWSFLSIPAVLAWMSIPAATGRREVLGVVLGLTVVLNGVELLERYRPLAKEGDAKRLARFLESHERPGQPILVFPNELAMPLRLYYAGANEIVPVPREVSLEVYDPGNPAIESREEIVGLLDDVAAEPAELWLVRREVRGYWGVSYRLELLDEVITSRYEATTEARFFDRVSVLRLRTRPHRRPTR